MSSEGLLGFNLEETTWPKKEFWTEVVKEDLRRLGVNMLFRRDVSFCGIRNSDEWINAVEALPENREHWAVKEKYHNSIRVEGLAVVLLDF
ncbi:hypothetical protein RB195_023333 [Necator americanus]|uniref:Uncharacterized protein n=1 Tax=Necator americanus TaxID=51031 RepID=A0ABR1EIY4_NECAM